MTLTGEAEPVPGSSIGRRLAVSAQPAFLHEMADILERTSPDTLARHPIGRTYDRAVQTAERRLAAAAQRLAKLRAVTGRRRLGTWRRAVPPVAGLEEAVADVEAAASAARRARSRAQLATDRWAELSRVRRTAVLVWCRRNAVPADAAALRQLAGYAELRGPQPGPRTGR